jgi:hypothetical protein
MKSVSILSFFILFLAACSSDADKFTGTWQSVKDPSKKITISQSGDSYTFEAVNLRTSLAGKPGTYNSKNNALDFTNDDGTLSQLVYNESVNHLIGLGDEFEKSVEASAATTTESDASESANATEDNETETESSAKTETGCGEGDILKITGNNVRVRQEPDVTKQNILFQVHLNFEVVKLDDKTVDGQKWYKVCYEGQQGWVSGQYATAK